MEKAYSRIKWENYPSVLTPLNETNLNKMDSALNEVDNRILGLDTAKLDKSTANTMVKDVSFNESTGVFTITLLNGTTKTIDTKLEKIATNFRFDYESQKLILTLSDGSEQEIDLSSLISQYEFLDGDIISFLADSDGKVSAIVKDGSITEEKLQPNFLADVKTEVAKAKSHSDSSYDNASLASTSAQEAKQYRDETEQFRNEVEAVVNVDIATTEKAGLVKPDGETITVDDDGTIHSIGSKGTSDVVYLTQAEYDALPDTKLTDGVEYRITDTGINDATASNVSYNNASSGIGATTVQQAVDELSSEVDGLSDSVGGLTDSLNNFKMIQLAISTNIQPEAQTGYIMHALRQGNLVIIRGRANCTGGNSLASNTWHTLTNVPYGYRPIKTESNFLAGNLRSGESIEGIIDTGGTFQIRTHVDVTQKELLFAHICYFTADEMP